MSEDQDNRDAKWRTIAGVILSLVGLALVSLTFFRLERLPSISSAIVVSAVLLFIIVFIWVRRRGKDK